MLLDKGQLLLSVPNRKWLKLVSEIYDSCLNRDFQEVVVVTPNESPFICERSHPLQI
jgi:hypothetical protein